MGYPQFIQVKIQQDARPGPTLPVDVNHIRAGQVCQGLDAFRVAFLDHQALFAVGPGYQPDGRVRQILAQVGDVVFSGVRVQQVRPGQVRFVAPQGSQPTQAAHVGRHQPSAPGGNELRQDIQGHVV